METFSGFLSPNEELQKVSSTAITQDIDFELVVRHNTQKN